MLPWRSVITAALLRLVLRPGRCVGLHRGRGGPSGRPRTPAQASPVAAAAPPALAVDHAPAPDRDHPIAALRPQLRQGLLQNSSTGSLVTRRRWPPPPRPLRTRPSTGCRPGRRSRRGRRPPPARAGCPALAASRPTGAAAPPAALAGLGDERPSRSRHRPLPSGSVALRSGVFGALSGAPSGTLSGRLTADRIAPPATMASPATVATASSRCTAWVAGPVGPHPRGLARGGAATAAACAVLAIGDVLGAKKPA